MKQKPLIQVELSDGSTAIYAKFTAQVAKLFRTRHYQEFTKDIEGCTVTVKGFEIVATNLGPPAEHVSLLVKAFDYLGGEKPRIGEPSPILEYGKIARLLKDGLGPEEDLTSVSQVGDQGRSTHAPSSPLSIASQQSPVHGTQFATQPALETQIPISRAEFFSRSPVAPRRRDEQLKSGLCRRDISPYPDHVDAPVKTNPKRHLLDILEQGGRVDSESAQSIKRKAQASLNPDAAPCEDGIEMTNRRISPSRSTKSDHSFSFTHQVPNWQDGTGQRRSNSNQNAQKGVSEYDRQVELEDAIVMQKPAEPTEPALLEDSAMECGADSPPHGDPSIPTILVLDEVYDPWATITNTRSNMLCDDEQEWILKRPDSWFPAKRGFAFPACNLPGYIIQDLGIPLQKESEEANAGAASESEDDDDAEMCSGRSDEDDASELGEEEWPPTDPPDPPQVQQESSMPERPTMSTQEPSPTRPQGPSKAALPPDSSAAESSPEFAMPESIHMQLLDSDESDMETDIPHALGQPDNVPRKETPRSQDRSSSVDKHTGSVPLATTSKAISPPRHVESADHQLDADVEMSEDVAPMMIPSTFDSTAFRKRALDRESGESPPPKKVPRSRFGFSQETPITRDPQMAHRLKRREFLQNGATAHSSPNSIAAPSSLAINGFRRSGGGSDNVITDSPARRLSASGTVPASSNANLNSYNPDVRDTVPAISSLSIEGAEAWGDPSSGSTPKRARTSVGHPVYGLGTKQTPSIRASASKRSTTPSNGMPASKAHIFGMGSATSSPAPAGHPSFDNGAHSVRGTSGSGTLADRRSLVGAFVGSASASPTLSSASYLPREAARSANKPQSIFRIFRTTYKGFSGDMSDFLALCERFSRLCEGFSKDQKRYTLPLNLADDFVVRHNLEYLPYTQAQMELGKTPEDYEDWYSNAARQSQHTEGIISLPVLIVLWNEQFALARLKRRQDLSKGNTPIVRSFDGSSDPREWPDDLADEAPLRVLRKEMVGLKSMRDDAHVVDLKKHGKISGKHLEVLKWTL